MGTNTIDRPRMTEARINKYFELARQACKFSDMHKTKVGSVFIYKNKVISVGYNSNKTAPIQALWNQERFDKESTYLHTLHAETTALLHAKNFDIDWSKVYVFNWRTKKDGSQGLSKPCKSCEAMLKNKGIKNIFYSTDSGWAFECFNNT